MVFDPASNMIGGFTDNDGTIDFYLRINSLLNPTSTVLDLGAGRAAWFEDDLCETRRQLRLLKGKVGHVIAADVDKAVISNQASDEQLVIEPERLGLPPGSVDLVVADYVLEHVDDADIFARQIDECLKSGGWLCARTPHKYSYVSIAATMVRNASHSKVLRSVQPERKEVDVFPTKYKMNTLRDIRRAFAGWEDKSFVARTDPAYYFGRKFVYHLQSMLHRITPRFFSGNLFIFVRKP
ncbi:MAG: methyltransferase domain-containing protein [Pseudomonadota bacterium]